ncbi:hypothetical protein [Streptomyces sp. 3214.6]|uniref:hypothetical protein n=1 Tax=Streptomyces sp. 3214.6 TaxID=1882757 RepID=UPI0015D558FC|nr:hypothetical protein [Streptomyces sp. 3214.6]
MADVFLQDQARWTTTPPSACVPQNCSRGGRAPSIAHRRSSPTAASSQNPDVVNVPAVWQSIAADARVQFHLATTDPLGRPTHGITRTPTPLRDFDTDDAVKFSLGGGQYAWPADAYLNIWVCRLRSGLLGYAQFPGGAAATDGVVITHSGFGTNGTAAAPFNGGRTATHEKESPACGGAGRGSLGESGN